MDASYIPIAKARGFTTHWISSKLSGHAIIPYRIMDCINVDDRIDFIQRAVLPVFNLWQDLIRHIRNLNAKQKIPPHQLLPVQGICHTLFCFLL